MATPNRQGVHPRMIRIKLFAALLLASTACQAQPPAAPTSIRANLPDQTALPFAVETIGTFQEPFAMAFLPGGALLVTEKAGLLQLRSPDGRTSAVPGVPTVVVGGQGGLLDVVPAPDFQRSHAIYLTYSAPAQGGSELAMARGVLAGIPTACVTGQQCKASPDQQLTDVHVLWRSGSAGEGGQYGATIVFAPDGQSLFLSSGERQRFTPAQDANQALGKILHLTLDGKPWPGNPQPGKLGAATVAVTDPPRDTLAAPTARARIIAARSPNTTPAETWSTGHRNPYGLAFDADGRLWEEEMGPRGGDEFNLILPGRNYGWPVVSNGDNYDGKPIVKHAARPEFEAPRLWWNPSISPGGMMIYSGALFPQWRGSAFIAALSAQALVRVSLDGDKATPGDQWAMGTRIRDVKQAPDGSIWLLEDGEKGAGGRLLRLTPKH